MTTVRPRCVPLPGGSVPGWSRSASRSPLIAGRVSQTRLRSIDGADQEVPVTGTVATADIVVPTLRAGGRVKLGWAVFALTFAGFVAALALDLHTGTYKTLVYLGGNVVLALIGAPADDSQARASDFVGAGGHGPLGDGRRSRLRVRGRGARRGPRLSPGWARRRLARQLVVASRARLAAERVAAADAGRPSRVASVVARTRRRNRRDGARRRSPSRFRRRSISCGRRRSRTRLPLDSSAVIVAGIVGVILVIAGLCASLVGLRSALPQVRR